MAYRVVATSHFAEQARNAPGELLGYVSAVVAVLRVDPTLSTVAFATVRDGDEYTAVFARGREFLTYWLPTGREVVVLLRLVWVT
ncbi:MAG TPA: hypothetical protein VGM21_03560 [Actinomycetota bacterium]